MLDLDALEAALKTAGPCPLLFEQNNPNIAALWNAAPELIAAAKRERRMRAATEKLFSLPNWEHRCGEWEDINKAITALAEARRALEERP